MAGPHGSEFHPPAFHHRFLGTLLGATMWFFIFYRARKDGPKLLGLSHPWDAHEHGDDHGNKEAHDEHH